MDISQVKSGVKEILDNLAANGIWTIEIYDPRNIEDTYRIWALDNFIESQNYINYHQLTGVDITEIIKNRSTVGGGIDQIKVIITQIGELRNVKKRTKKYHKDFMYISYLT